MDEHGHDHKKEEEFNRLIYLQSIYNQRFEAITNELTTYSMAHAALQRSLDLLSKKDELTNASILLNAEGGMYIEAGIKGISKVITYIGAGYLVEKDIESAKAYMSKNLSSGDEAIKRLANDRHKLEGEMIKVQYSIDMLQQGQ